MINYNIWKYLLKIFIKKNKGINANEDSQNIYLPQASSQSGNK